MRVGHKRVIIHLGNPYNRMCCFFSLRRLQFSNAKDAQSARLLVVVRKSLC